MKVNYFNTATRNHQILHYKLVPAIKNYGIIAMLVLLHAIASTTV